MDDTLNFESRSNGRPLNGLTFYRPMRRRLLIIASVFLILVAIGIGGALFAINRAVESRNGPIHRFPFPAEETFLTDDRAAAIGREVMNRDRYPESAWRMRQDDRSKAPDGRSDRFFLRNTLDPDQGVVSFFCDQSPTPTRYVNIEVRNGEVTAQGTLGK